MTGTDQTLPGLEIEEVSLTRTGRSGSSRAVTRLNDAMVIAVAVLLAVIPLFYGANRPVFWLAASLAVAVLSAVYFASVAMHDPDRGIQWRNYRLVVIPGLLVIGFALLQLVPGPVGGVSDLPDALRPGRISIDWMATALGVVRLCSYLLLFVLVSELCTHMGRTERLGSYLFYGIVAQALLALLSFALLDDTLLLGEKEAYRGFVTGSFINRNSFATFIGMGVILGVSEIGYRLTRVPERRPTRRMRLTDRIDGDVVLMAMLVGLMVAALAASGSRAGLICTFLGAWFSLVLLMLRAGVRLSRVFGLSVFLGGIAFLIVLLLLGQSLAERLIFVSIDSGVRLELYAQSLAAALERPLTGFGLDNFPAMFELLHQPTLPGDTVWDKPHNTYLTLWSELGFVAGSLPILAVGLAFILALRLIWVRERNYHLSVALCGIIIQVGFHSLADFSLEIPAVTYLFVAIAAIGIARRRQAGGQG